MNHTPDKLPAAPHAENELHDLQQQVARARAVLANLRRQIADTRGQRDGDDGISLIEVNEQLVISALQSQTDAEQAAQALGELSRSYGLDMLTQLPNRVHLQERFSHAIASAHRHRNHVAILFVDIDGFKVINDTLGHAVGDEVIKHAAHCIANSVRDIDFVCRYGGDEFVVLVTDLAQACDANLVSQKIASTVATPITMGSRTLSISLSIGVSSYPDDGVEADTLMRRADLAMYEAKRRKGNRLGTMPS
ncbi:diguanylate cyclase domain-containing protein [Simplicispira piscis]